MARRFYDNKTSFIMALMLIYGAEGRNRTDMDLRPLDFESSLCNNLTILYHSIFT
jgi:hypothetical protein